MIYSSFSWHIVLSLHVLVGFLRPKPSSLQHSRMLNIYTLQHSSHRYPKNGLLENLALSNQPKP